MKREASLWRFLLRLGLTDRCDGNDGDDPGGAWDQTYPSWWGYGSLPKLQANSAEVRDLI